MDCGVNCKEGSDYKYRFLKSDPFVLTSAFGTRVHNSKLKQTNKQTNKQAKNKLDESPHSRKLDNKMVISCS